jgi:simple sugar transport system permease protein
MIKKLSRQNETYITLVALVLCVVIEARSGQFFTPNNLVDLASALIVPGMFAIGVFLVIVSGGIDVSFPALASLAVYATTKFLLDTGYPGGIWLPILIALALGAVLGAVNGFLISWFNLPAMIVTLGTASSLKGSCRARSTPRSWRSSRRGWRPSARARFSWRRTPSRA